MMDFLKHTDWQVMFGISVGLMILLAIRETFRGRMKGGVWLTRTAFLSLVAMVAWLGIHVRILSRLGWAAALASLVCSFLVGTILVHLLRAASTGRPKQVRAIAKHDNKVRNVMNTQNMKMLSEVITDYDEYKTLLHEFLQQAAVDRRISPIMAQHGLSQVDLEDIHRRASLAGLDGQQACASVYDPVILEWYGVNVGADRKFTFEQNVEFAFLLRERA